MLTASDVATMPVDERRRIFVRVIGGDLCRLLRRGQLARIAERYDTFEDAEQTAMLGLVIAADRYDPAHGAKPLTWCYWMVRRELTKGLRRAKRRRIAPEVALAMLADYRASEGDPAIVIGEPVQRELFA